MSYSANQYKKAMEKAYGVVIENPSVGTPPFAPTGLQAQAGQNQIVLSWSTVSGAAGFRVFKATSQNGTYANISPNGGQLTTALTDTDVVAGTTYYYYVVAYNAAGDSLASSLVNASPTAPPTTTPVVTIAAPTKIHLFGVASKDVHIYFNDGDKIDEKTYVIQRSAAGANNWQSIKTISPATTSKGLVVGQRIPVRHYVDANLTAGNYDYRIRAEYGQNLAVSQVFTVTLSGNEYYVDFALGNDANAGTSAGAGAWKTLSKAFAAVTANQGHRINFKGVTTLTSRQNLKQGVSLKGYGKDGSGNWLSKITYEQNSLYDMSLAALAYENGGSRTVENLNACLSDFAIEGNKKGRRAILLRSIRGVTFDNIEINRMYWHGLELRYRWEFVCVKNSTLKNSGYTPPISGDTWGNEGNSHYGTIYARGSGNNLFITDCTAEYNDGYWFKAGPSYEDLEVPGDYNTPYDRIEDTIICNIVGVGGLRTWNGTSAPEFFVEVWNVDAWRVAFYNNETENQYSLEKKNKNRPTNTYSFLLCDSYIKAEQAAAVELSNSDTILDNVFFYYKDGNNIYEGVGDFNSKPQNIGADNVKIMRCLFYFGNRSSPVLSSRNIYTNLKIWNCVFVYDVLPPHLINMVSKSGENNNGWTGFEMKNVAVVAPVATNNDFRLVRRTGDNTVYDLGDGMPSMPGAVFDKIIIPKAGIRNPSGATVSLTLANPQVAGGSDLRAAYKPAATSNMLNQGVNVGLPISGSAADIGFFESGISVITIPTGGGNQSGGSNGGGSTPTIPAAPVLGSATGIQAGQFTIDWAAVSGADFYKLDVATDTSFTNKVVNDVTVSGTSTTQSGLSASTTYYVRVRAGNAAGVSPNSNVASFTTQAASGTRTFVIGVNCGGPALASVDGDALKAGDGGQFTDAGTGITINPAGSYQLSRSQTDWNPAISGDKLTAMQTRRYNVEDYTISGLTNGNYELEIYSEFVYRSSNDIVTVYPQPANASNPTQGAITVTMTPDNTDSFHWKKTTVPVSVVANQIRITDPQAIGSPEGDTNLNYWKLFRIS
jgi:hypothetical protein